MVTPDSDTALVLAARSGDGDAFAALLRRHQPLLISLCRRMLRDRELARDAAQEASIQALLSLDRLRRPERFGPWLAGIGLNVARIWLRERPHESWSWEALQGGRHVLEPVDRSIGPEEQAEATDLAVRVRSAVDTLPRGQRAAVLLFYLAGLTYSETAAQLGIDVGAVKTRLHKARTNLKRQLWRVWMEEHMAVKDVADVQWLEMRVADVRRMTADTGRPNRHVVVLEDAGGEHSLLIWVGPYEGAALAWQLERAETSRPLTFTFTANILQAAGGRLREVRINKLAEETYYAIAVIEGARRTVQVDARPSDALTLALTLNAPILVDPAVLMAAEASSPPDHRAPTELADLRARSVGPAEIVAEVTAPWVRKVEAETEGQEPPPAERSTAR